ncbi:uncharacterized protein GGS22DRAFT_143703 [Annulohypoxylon maeteangense]|uniref:uncharacterized protein n=1 Tax=Annulohypoxylon maeteangense TaxID=1927788 RepID=UPI002008B04B|nr:uncharacterized protein GGS22DRAFT_143703 [Annulohypoxylon maeteangense]KAI0884521.1 hypothetical protein GGS22DRAFT_143703 [Annulohypoxylon maeteangense]
MASYLGLEKNISYHTIPAAVVLALLPRVYSGLTGPGKKVFDGNNPRLFPQALEKSDLDKKLKGRLQRAEAASSNGFETLGFYAAAVTAGNAGGVSAATLNNLTLGYLASRVFYTWIYIWGQENRKWIVARPNVWGVGMALSITMFVLAGMKGN